MFCVALLALTAPVETEAQALAPDLGLTAYEMRLRLVAPKPSIMLQTPDRDRANKLASKLQQRGHGAIAFDTHDVIGGSSLTNMDHYRLLPDGVALDPQPNGTTAEPLPYDDVAALMLAMHRSGSNESHEEKTTTFSPARALLSGGLVRNRTTTKTVTTSTEEREQVLYIYRRVGPPWIFRERARHAGAPIATGRLATFRAVVAQLRASCPRATYDERLMHAKAPELLAHREMSAALASSNEQGMDLLAFALAHWIGQAQGDPYRSR